MTTPEALTPEEERRWRIIHVGKDGPFTADTCYNCWQGICPVPVLLATLDAERAARVTPTGHPDDPLRHEFVTTCRLCGEPGTLVIAFITPDEQVRTEVRP